MFFVSDSGLVLHCFSLGGSEDSALALVFFVFFFLMWMFVSGVRVGRTLPSQVLLFVLCWSGSWLRD